MSSGQKTALINWAAQQIRDSADLQAIMGSDIRLRLIWAQPNEEFPYLVHRFDLKPDPDAPFIYYATWMLDIWCFGPDASDAVAIRDLLVGMFHRNFYGTFEGLRDPRVWLEQEGDIPQEDPRIWRTSLQFGIRFTATADLSAVLARE